MGELKHQKIELYWINLFYSAIKGKAGLDREPVCFRTLNYKELVFVSFPNPQENKKQKMNDITPDFLLWNKEKQVVLIIEVKGENSVELKHISQLNKYNQISIKQIQELLRNVYDDPTILIQEVFTGIVYREETINNCETSNECISRLSTISKNYIIFTQSQEGKFKAYNIKSIDFDNDLRESLEIGFDLPLNPPREIYLTDNPCMKGILWGIVNQIHDSFYEGDDLEEITTNTFDLREKLKYSQVKPSDIEIALAELSRLDICTQSNRNYTFQFESIKNLTEIQNKIQKLNCNIKRKPIQKALFSNN